MTSCPHCGLFLYHDFCRIAGGSNGAFLASFLVVFLAELGDKTQFIVMAFTAKYRWQSVFAGMTLGILVVHSLAVAVGSLAGQLIPVHLMTIIASCLFIGFGVWTLRGDDEEEEENVHPSRFGPLLTVAMTSSSVRWVIRRSSRR